MKGHVTKRGALQALAQEAAGHGSALSAGEGRGIELKSPLEHRRVEATPILRHARHDAAVVEAGSRDVGVYGLCPEHIRRYLAVRRVLDFREDHFQDLL